MRVSVLIASVAVASASQLHAASDPAFIKEVAAKAKTWTPGVNQRFVGATVDNVRRLMGTKRDAARHARLPSVAHCDAACAAAIPATFNASAAFPWATSISFIRDQSDCGSCWAVSSTESFNDRMQIANKTRSILSSQATTSCCNPNNGCSGSNGCDGGFTEDAWNYYVKTGLPTGGENPSVGSGSSCYPYQIAMCDHHEGGPYPACPSICNGGECATPKCAAPTCTEKKYNRAWSDDVVKAAGPVYRIASVADAQAEIMARGPITASFDVYADFLTYKVGFYVR